MLRKYNVEFDRDYNDFSFTVEIDFDAFNINKIIKEAVHFWNDESLYSIDDYISKFLKNLGCLVLKYAIDNYTCDGIISEVSKLEGWFSLDGSMGIKLLCCDDFQLDGDDFEITKK